MLSYWYFTCALIILALNSFSLRPSSSQAVLWSNSETPLFRTMMISSSTSRQSYPTHTTPQRSPQKSPLSTSLSRQGRYNGRALVTGAWWNVLQRLLKRGLNKADCWKLVDLFLFLFRKGNRHVPYDQGQLFWQIKKASIGCVAHTKIVVRNLSFINFFVIFHSTNFDVRNLKIDFKGWQSKRDLLVMLSWPST